VVNHLSIYADPPSTPLPLERIAFLVDSAGSLSIDDSFAVQLILTDPRSYVLHHIQSQLRSGAISGGPILFQWTVSSSPDLFRILTTLRPFLERNASQTDVCLEFLRLIASPDADDPETHQLMLMLLKAKLDA
jgi:hypothetical protein